MFYDFNIIYSTGKFNVVNAPLQWSDFKHKVLNIWLFTLKSKLRVKGDLTAKTPHLKRVIVLGVTEKEDPYKGFSALFLDLIYKA